MCALYFLVALKWLRKEVDVQDEIQEMNAELETQRRAPKVYIFSI